MNCFKTLKFLGEIRFLGQVSLEVTPLIHLCHVPCLALSSISVTNSKTKLKIGTTFPSLMNTKLTLHGVWHCHENGLNKTMQTITHNLYVSHKLTSLYRGLRIILVYPNPQSREADLTLTYRLWVSSELS